MNDPHKALNSLPSYQTSKGSKGSGTWVYYARLNEDAKKAPYLAGYYDTGMSLINSMASGFDSPKQKEEITLSIQAQADIEKDKELSALKNAWDVDFDDSILASPDFYSYMIKTMNTFMQSEAVYKRNMQRIQYKGDKQKSVLAKIDISKMFGSYWDSSFNQLKPEIVDMFVAAAQSNNPDTILDARADKIMKKVLYLTLEKMFTSHVFDPYWKNPIAQKANEEYDSASENPYFDLAEQLENDWNAQKDNSFFQEVWKTFHLDDMTNALKDIAKSKSFATSMQNVFDEARKTINKTTSSSSTAGLLNEVILTEVLSNLRAGPDISVEHTGGRNWQKADMIMVIKGKIDSFLDEQQRMIEEIRRNGEKSIRLQNILATNEAMKLMDWEVPGLNFIAFTNAKSASLEKHFLEQGGFRSGEPMPLKNFSTAIQTASGVNVQNANTLISALIQFGSGAVGHGSGKEEQILYRLSELIAYFLFDDFTTIGADFNASGTNALHLFYLNGVYIPLSFMLTNLAEAISQSWERSKDVVNITLNTVDCDSSLLNKSLGAFTPEDWASQRDSALAGTSLTVNFMKSFQDIMSAIKL